MSSLPQEIEKDILLRLPVKSILRLKSVCKSWYALLWSPKLFNHHLILTRKNPRLMIRYTYTNPWANKYIFYSVDYSSILSASSLTTCKCEGVVLMDDPVNREAVSVSSRYIQSLGSCNGLVCIGVNENRTWIIWNPSTKESKKFLVPVYWPGSKAYGFGYDTKISKYKLVCIEWTEVYACTLESNYTWRRVTETPYKYFNASAGLLLNGVLHWLVTIVTQYEPSKGIVAFDISSEKFMNMHFPEETMMLYQNGSCYLKLLGDSLCLVCGVSAFQVDVWVMQNYGVTESWTKQFTTTQEEITQHPYSLKLYWSLENGEILIQTSNGFGLYDQENDCVRLLEINGTGDSFFAVTSESYVESLVSLTCNRNLLT